MGSPSEFLRRPLVAAAAVAVDAVVLVVTAGFLWTVEDADVVVVEPEPPPNLKTTRRGT